jgi:hypothetical protein
MSPATCRAGGNGEPDRKFFDCIFGFKSEYDVDWLTQCASEAEQTASQ